MTSPFVPVDLDKLLDEFEENEEVPKPGQQRSVKIEDDSPSDRSLSSHKGPKQCFQPAFPCIQEEVLSDQGSDGRLEDKDDKDDSSSDSSSISGVIEAAEAITNHSQLTTTHKNTGNIISNGHVFPDAHNMVTYTSGNSVSNQEEGSCESDELNYFHNEHVVNNTGSSSYSQGMYTTSPVVDSQNEACHNSISQEGDGRCVLDNTPSNKPEFEQSPGKQQSNSSAEENEINIGSDLDFAISSVTPEQSDLNGMNQSDSSGTHNNLACGSSDSEDRGGSSEEQLVQTTVNSRTSQSPDQSGLHLRSDHGESVYMDDTSRPVDERWTDSDYNTSLAELQNDLHAIELDETRMSDTNLERLSPGGGHALSVHDSDSRHVSFEESTGINTGPFELSNQESSYQDFDPVTEPWEDSVLASQISGSSMGMKAQGFTGARRISSGEACLGRVPPIWVPDSVATHCMNCGLKFSVIKRRHHCRACGKALCSSCCNMKFLLPYLDNREGRVCQVCCNALLRAQALLQVSEEEIDNLESDVTSSLMQVEPEDNCEESALLSNSDQEDLLENGQSMEGAEEEEDHSADFAGVDMTRERTLPVLAPLQLPVPALSLPNTDTPLATPTSPALSDDSDCLFRLDVDNVRSLLPQDITALPPVLSVVNEEITIQERPDPAEIMYQLKGCHETVVFMLNKNLVVKVKIVKLRCCVKRKCWCFVTEGMGAANQEEMVVLLECLDRETMVPKDVLSHFNTAFAYAKQGHTVSELGYTIFGQPFLGNSDNAGFLYVKPTFQCVKNLPLPFTPYVVGVLIRRMETPWAQLFPLRLQLRLGAEYRYYPCPLFSTRNRTAVYGEIGHTIMNLLADFKNFQYTLARVTGLVIHMEENKTVVRLPQDRYDEIVKILNATDEHVMALGANFSQQADSHLVCIQNEQGYKTQAINIQNQARKVTGASFIVFSGALKASSPFTAKVNIVEDGIMVQLMPKVIGELRHALKEMQDYTITSGAPGKTEDELVVVEWISRQEALQETSVCSPIDGLQLDCFPCVKVHSGCDFTRKSVFRIQWTEVFFLGDRRNSSAAWQQCASRDLNQLTAELAKAYCQSLMPHLCRLSNDNSTLIGLRVNLDSDNVGYSTGSNNQCLAGDIMADLDAVLVPVIHSAANRHRGRPLSVELFFKILRLL